MNQNKIDFQDIASRALGQASSLVPAWLPGGKQESGEWVALNPRRPDKSLGSFRVNLGTGKWMDFADDSGEAKGGDLISLYAYINITTQIRAATELADQVGACPPAPPAVNTGRTVYVRQISPVPPDAPPLPTEVPVKTESGWVRYPISHRWAYHDETGALLGYVVRYQTPEGKETPPYTLWEVGGGGYKWRQKSFAEPRPLYGLDRLKKHPIAQVLLVSGEKCTEVLQDAIDTAGYADDLVAITWPGGDKSIRKINWLPLKGRRVILWPDADKSGTTSMKQVTGILGSLGCTQAMLDVPADKPQGWDVADAILLDGWTFDQVIEFIRATKQVVHTQSPAALTSELPGSTPVTTPAEPASDPVPFRCLGYSGDYYFYLPRGTRQVKGIRAESHGAGTLMSIADLTYWERVFPGSQGPAWKQASNALMRKCESVGVYDPMMQRGRGAWFDKNRSVLHLGDRLLVDGVPVGIDEIKSRYIYEAGPVMEFTDAAPLPLTEAHKLREITDALFWEKPIYSVYLAGWCMVAPICGALGHRPHIWLTGTAGSGKTYVMDNIVRVALGEFALPVQSSTTSAGVRQALQSDARPVLLDEFEGEDFESQRRQQSMLELARQAFSDSGAKILKGSQGGKVQAYQIRSSFCFSSIGVGLSQHADETRVVVLSLVRPVDMNGETAAEHFAKLGTQVATTLTPDWCAALRARAIRMIPMIRKNAEVFASVVAEKLKSRRSGDQVGALLAGAYALSSDGEITTEQAVEWVEKQDWSEQRSTAEASDEMKLLSTILYHTVRLSPASETTVAELIHDVVKNIKNISEAFIPGEITDEERALRRLGLRYDKDDSMLYVSDSSPGVRCMLDKSPWAKSHARILKRIPGSVTKQMRFLEGSSRATGIPIALIGITQS